MEAYQIALVIILLGCVGALFFLWFKNRQAPLELANPEEEEEKVEEEEPYSVIDPKHFVPEPKISVPVNQCTIYAFEREIQVYVCPRCDGENSINRKMCCICGLEFKKGAR